MVDMPWMALRHGLGLARSDELVRIGEALMEQDYYTTDVIELATLKNPTMAEAGPLFEKICRELVVFVPMSRRAAIDGLLRRHLEDIRSSRRPPINGLDAIMREVYWPYFSSEPCKESCGDLRGLHHLIGAYWGYDDLTQRPHEVSWDGKYGGEAIAAWGDFVRQCAEEWLDTYGELPGPDVWMR